MTTRSKDKLLSSIKHVREVLNTFPQGSDLDFEKLMNPAFSTQVNNLKAQLQLMIKSLCTSTMNTPSESQEISMVSVSKHVDLLVQRSV